MTAAPPSMEPGEGVFGLLSLLLRRPSPPGAGGGRQYVDLGAADGKGLEAASKSASSSGSSLDDLDLDDSYYHDVDDFENERASRRRYKRYARRRSLKEKQYRQWLQAMREGARRRATTPLARTQEPDAVSRARRAADVRRSTSLRGAALKRGDRSAMTLFCLLASAAQQQMPRLAPDAIHSDFEERDLSPLMNLYPPTPPARSRVLV
mmetsp:Transcript_5595/g.16476  ORF Transcript_5595/g.16476 Transcript_5595/m.16476 type:complete len:208 (+) Transcript_5595:239-862(+)